MVDKERVRPNISRGSTELVILSLLESEAIYGFEIAKRIEERSGGVLRFELASLYPMLHGLEKKGYLSSRHERSGRRERRLYDITETGRIALANAKTKLRELFGELIEGR